MRASAKAQRSPPVTLRQGARPPGPRPPATMSRSPHCHCGVAQGQEDSRGPRAAEDGAEQLRAIGALPRPRTLHQVQLALLGRPL
eukprot:14057650-Alexandrium_andersonii.AAC.1